MPGVYVRNLILVLVSLLMMACAPQTEFYTVPQHGANRTGIYPRFSDRPKAETEQFTSEERTRLIRSLEEMRGRKQGNRQEN